MFTELSDICCRIGHATFEGTMCHPEKKKKIIIILETCAGNAFFLT